MKKSALYKDIFREIWRTKARFLSIFAIITLGVGFFSGIKATGPNMIDTADHYYKEKKLMDMKVVSTYGLNQDDIATLEKIQGATVAPSYSQEVFLGTTGIVAKITSLPPEKNPMNGYRVMEGRLPEKSGEIALDNVDKLKKTYKIGDEVTFTTSESKELNLSKTFKQVTYKVVGFVNNPMYIETYTRGTSSIGKGTIDGFGVIVEDDFKADYFTEAYLTFDGTKDLQSYSTKYEDQIEKEKKLVDEAIKNRPKQRLEEIKKEGQQKITDGEKKITDAKAQLAEGEKQLNEAKGKLDEGETAYAEGMRQLQTELANAEATLNENQAELTNKTSELTKNEADVAAGETQLAAARSEFDTKKKEAETQIQQGKLFVDGANQALVAPIDQVPPKTSQELIESATAIDANLGQLLTGYFAGIVAKEQVTEALSGVSAKLTASENELASGETQLNQKEQELITAKSQLAAARTQLESGQRAIDEGRTQFINEKENGEEKLRASRTELDEGQQSYQASLAEFTAKKATGEAEIAEGEKELADARKQLDDVAEPEYYVFDRMVNPGYGEFKDNANRISAIAKIFPVFFFLIAALVSLTTMTRMVEEQRLQIGTLKALGYSDKDIALKFILYAFLASVTATFVGLAIGYQLFPNVIFSAYGSMYNLPSIRITYYLSYGVVSLLVSLLCTVVSALLVAWVELKSNAATLMRPKAPKSGKRILLERIPFIWNRFGFNQKVTARNLFRYKQRMLMTVLGIAGCTALILTGFGLKDSIADIGGLQYGKIMRYQAVTSFNADATEKDKESYDKLISETKEIKHTLLVSQDNYKVAKKDVNTQEATVFVPKTTKEFDEFVRLRNRQTKETYKIPKSGALVTEKLAKLFDLEVGDSFEIQDSDNKVFKIKVEGITENYAGHNIYISPAYYEQVFGTAPTYNTELITYKENQKWENQFGEKLTANPRVAGVTFVNRIGNTFEDTMSSLNIVTLVLIVSAALLAFVVLYNLTNINVSERIRELSTIKVLGFYDREVSLYIYRENIILTFMGIGVGLVLGILLHGFVLDTAEIDIMMFSPVIKLWSYVYSALLTFLFSGIVMFAMHLKLKKIDMIEALKSVD